SLVGLVVVMVWMDPLLSLIALVIGPPLVYAVNYLMRRLRTVTREAVEVNARLLGAMQESMQGIAIIKAFTMEEVLAQKIAGLIAYAENRSNKIARGSERLGPVTESLAGFAIAAVIAYAGWRAAVSAEPPGSAFAFITALLLAYDPVRKLARVQVNVERALVNARMIYEILDLEPRQEDVPGAKELVVSRGDVVFDRVRFAYDGHRPVLRDVSFEARAGKTTAIVGPSGADRKSVV